MNNVLIFLLVASFLAVALVSGGIAKLFKAKHPSMLLAFLVVCLAVGTAVGIHCYVMNDSMIVLGSALAVYVVLLSLLLGMKTLDTFITGIAGIATMGMMLFAGSMMLDKQQEGSMMDTMLSYVEDNQSFISFSTLFHDNTLNTTNGDHDHKIPVKNEEFVVYNENELLPEGARQELKTLESKLFHPVKVTDAYKLKGNIVRILKKNGDSLQGTITTTRGNSLILGIYLPDSKGMIAAPVPLSVISKLEVYR